MFLSDGGLRAITAGGDKGISRSWLAIYIWSMCDTFSIGGRELLTTALASLGFAIHCAFVCDSCAIQIESRSRSVYAVVKIPCRARCSLHDRNLIISMPWGHCQGLNTLALLVLSCTHLCNRDNSNSWVSNSPATVIFEDSQISCPVETMYRSILF